LLAGCQKGNAPQAAVFDFRVVLARISVLNCGNPNDPIGRGGADILEPSQIAGCNNVLIAFAPSICHRLIVLSVEVQVESRHYFREKGAKAEKIIHELSVKTFFTDWCYLNPPRPDGKELCDLLVVFDDTAVIWQIKDLKVDANGRYKQAEVDKIFVSFPVLADCVRNKGPSYALESTPRDDFSTRKDKESPPDLCPDGEGEGPLPFMDSIKDSRSMSLLGGSPMLS